MSHHDHDELWQLLGHARKPSMSPFFARNVVREVRDLKQEGVGVPRWVLIALRYWQLPALGACALAIAVTAALHRTPPSASAADPQLLAIAEKVSRSPDFRVIGQLDELMESEQNSVWLAGDSY